MKRFATAAALLMAALPFAGSASAEEFPTREIRLVCGFAAGSGADIIHRYFAEKLAQVSGKSFIVENKPGAAGNLAHTYVARSRPDGYTVYPVGGNSLAASLSLFKQPPIDPTKELEPIGTTIKQGWIVLVDAKSPHRTLKDLTAYLKEKKGNASYATATVVGTVMAELYKQIAGLETVQVNYRTIADSLNDVQSGRVDAVFGDPAFTLAQVKAGRLRALGISTSARVKSMPDIPTMAEGGVPGIDLTVWWATMVPAGTPQPVKDKLRGWFDQVLRMPETEQFLRNIGTDVYMSTPQEAQAFLLKEVKNWADNIRTAKIQPN